MNELTLKELIILSNAVKPLLDKLNNKKNRNVFEEKKRIELQILSEKIRLKIDIEYLTNHLKELTHNTNNL